jgi:hypothetical protein
VDISGKMASFRIFDRGTQGYFSHNPVPLGIETTHMDRSVHVFAGFEKSF